jgi:hypothetical protein
VNAEKRKADAEASAGGSSLANDQTPASRLSTETVSAIAKETGLKPSTIKDANYFGNAVGDQANVPGCSVATEQVAT